MFQYVNAGCVELVGAAVHVTHDLSIFISPNLNGDDTELIETANEEQIETRGSGTIDWKLAKTVVSPFRMSTIALSWSAICYRSVYSKQRGLNFKAKTVG